MTRSTIVLETADKDVDTAQELSIHFVDWHGANETIPK